LGSSIAPLQNDVAGSKIARAEFQHHGNSAPLPMEELRARALGFAVIHLRADILRDAVCRLKNFTLLVVFTVDGNEYGLDRRQPGRKHQTFVVGVAPDEPAG